MALPLTSVRVIEIDGLGPVTFAGMMLADMGAEVLRLTRAGTVDSLDRAAVTTLTAEDVADAARALGGDPSAPPELSRWQRWMG